MKTNRQYLLKMTQKYLFSYLYFENELFYYLTDIIRKLYLSTNLKMLSITIPNNYGP